jgi:Ca2+/Na+ antiporter
LVVSIKAALSQQGDISVGNVVGSNSFNIGVILGLTALVCPIPVHSQSSRSTRVCLRGSYPAAFSYCLIKRLVASSA